MASNPTTKSQQTQTPPAPSSRPGSSMSWAEAVKTPSRSTTPDPSALPARPSRTPSAMSSPSRPPESGAAPPKQAASTSGRRQGSQSPSRRPATSKSAAADPHASRTAASAPTANQSPPTEPSVQHVDADEGNTAGASAASAGSSSAASSKKRKKKKKAKADPSTDGAAAASDPALDPDLVALEEARQLAAIPVEHVEWAKRVIKLAERYTNRIGNTGPEGMRLTRVDDELYTRFRADFPTFNVESIAQDELTGAGFAEKWQALHADFSDMLPAVYAHHLMRPVAAREYADDNTMMVTAAQFYAIEIARNREGANQGFYEALKDQVNSKAAAKP